MSQRNILSINVGIGDGQNVQHKSRLNVQGSQCHRDKMLQWTFWLGQNVTVDVVNLDVSSRHHIFCSFLYRILPNSSNSDAFLPCPGRGHQVEAEAAQHCRHPPLRQPRRGVQGKEIYVCTVQGKEIFVCTIQGKEIYVCTVKGKEIYLCTVQGKEIYVCTVQGK